MRPAWWSDRGHAAGANRGRTGETARVPSRACSAASFAVSASSGRSVGRLVGWSVTPYRTRVVRACERARARVCVCVCVCVSQHPCRCLSPRTYRLSSDRISLATTAAHTACRSQSTDPLTTDPAAPIALHCRRRCTSLAVVGFVSATSTEQARESENEQTRPGATSRPPARYTYHHGCCRRSQCHVWYCSRSGVGSAIFTDATWSRRRRGGDAVRR